MAQKTKRVTRTQRANYPIGNSEVLTQGETSMAKMVRLIGVFVVLSFVLSLSGGCAPPAARARRATRPERRRRA